MTPGSRVPPGRPEPQGSPPRSRRRPLPGGSAAQPRPPPPPLLLPPPPPPARPGPAPPRPGAPGPASAGVAGPKPAGRWVGLGRVGHRSAGPVEAGQLRRHHQHAGGDEAEKAGYEVAGPVGREGAEDYQSHRATGGHGDPRVASLCGRRPALSTRLPSLCAPAGRSRRATRRVNCFHVRSWLFGVPGAPIERTGSPRAAPRGGERSNRRLGRKGGKIGPTLGPRPELVPDGDDLYFQFPAGSIVGHRGAGALAHKSLAERGPRGDDGCAGVALSMDPTRKRSTSSSPT